MRHQAAIEDALFGTIRTLFSLDETVTLYDLTNTYFEGEAAANAKARHGRSKEKRSDCALLTLGLVLDASGFVRRSRTYTMLTDLESVFRSLKSELGMRPVFHTQENRADGHLFITVLAYQCVQFLRKQLQADGITGSWSSLR